MRLPCPACPDGNVWSSEGPTGAPCPVCHGKAYVGEDESDDEQDDESEDEE